MSEKKASPTLALTSDFLKRAGITIGNTEKDAAKARAALIEANSGKGYVPMNKGANTVLEIMEYAREEIAAGESATKRVCIALSSVDMAGAYKLCHDETGKPYTSMLAFAMDVMPNLSKSTIAGYIGVGRTVYVPAINGKYGKSSTTLLNLPPSTLDALKANLNNEQLCDDTVDVLRAAANAKGVNLTQKLAKSIAKVVKDRNAMTNKPDMKPSELLKAAMGDVTQNEKIYGKPDSNPGGATKNGGNAESAEFANSDVYNAIKAKVTEYLSVIRNEKGTNALFIGDDKQRTGLAGFLRKVMVANDGKSANLVCRALAEMLEK